MKNIRISVTRIKVKEIAMVQVHHDMYRYAHFLRRERREAVNKNVTRVGSRKVCHAKDCGASVNL